MYSKQKEENMSTFNNTRRDFLKQSLYLGTTAFTAGPLCKVLAMNSARRGARMKLGLVTYLWGKDWDVPTLIINCEKAGILGVELRTQHAHGVESDLTARQRRRVKRQFAKSSVTLVGLGTNFAFHHTDPTRLKSDIEGAKKYIKLSHDVGGSGVKVKPNDLPKNISKKNTIKQIGESLNELGRYGARYGQEIRLEVHGSCSPLPVIKAIMDVADNPNVGVCWNSNSQDLQGEGLEYNFNLVKERFADTVHIRELNIGNYPYQELMNLFVAMDYDGWILLEARTNPDDRVKALIEQRQVFEDMVAKAQKAGTDRKIASGVKITEADDKLQVNINGKLFTEYCFNDVPRPYFYPVIGPTGEPIIRHYPMKDINPDEAKDHVHHKSLWYTHGEINGHDFWGEGSRSGKVVHDKFLKVASGKDVGVIQSKNKYVARDGKIVCTDTRTHRFYNRKGHQIMDFEITFHASKGKLVLGDTKEGSMAIRLATTMRLRTKDRKVGKGHILNSEGQRDGETWGKRAAWCDYYGPVKGEIVGVAIFDHPENPKHPTWWHVRDYGLFTANPFGVHNFERKPKGVGDITIPVGESLTFKYRFYFHKGDTNQADVAKHYREYATSK
jgi:sugar phosphate isomerase/epimerase